MLTHDVRFIATYLEQLTRDTSDPITNKAEVTFFELAYELHWISVEQLNEILLQLLDLGIVRSFDESMITVDRKKLEEGF